MAKCPSCSSEELRLLGDLADGRKHLSCDTCGHDWLKGEPIPTYESSSSTSLGERISGLRATFPSTSDIAPEIGHRVGALATRFSKEHPRPRPNAYAFAEKYRQIFTPEGLRTAKPDDLHLFANSSLVARPGNMSVFNREWNRIGPEEGTRRVVEAVDYLLYGPDDRPLEHRLTDLIEENKLGMKGFKEALLTKVLCIAKHDRFLPILKYTGMAGKAEIANLVFNLRLPDPDKSRWRIGYLILWSNDLLMELVRRYYQDSIVAGAFLWWAKDQEKVVSDSSRNELSNMVSFDGT